MACNIIGNTLARHAPRQIRVGAEGLLIHKVAPAADRLPDQQAGGTDVEKRKQLYPAPFAADDRAKRAADDCPVKAQSAAAQVEDRAEIPGIFVPAKRDVIETRADDAQNGGGHHDIQRMVAVKAEFFKIPKRKK